MKNFYDASLQGHSYDHQQAMSWAQGFVFSECESTERRVIGAEHIGTVEGIEVYYHPITDMYLFCDDDDDQPEEKSQKQKLATATQAVADLMIELENIHYLMENEVDSDEAWESVIEELDNQAGTIGTIITEARSI